jgi:hypothetical protein
VKHEEHVPVKEIGELLDTVSEKVPGMISKMLKTLYSREAGENMGQATGAFYKELLAAGIPKEEALQMTKDYLNTLKNVANSISPAGAKQEFSNK